ncbi:hypothetical protein, partial [Kocuria rhizophila]|uniref:hypothetical protein n=1 Tax=Kocuria rhizophila TaxID=72000 RepID=UPI001C92D6EE
APDQLPVVRRYPAILPTLPIILIILPIPLPDLYSILTPYFSTISHNPPRSPHSPLPSYITSLPPFTTPAYLMYLSPLTHPTSALHQYTSLSPFTSNTFFCLNPPSLT